MALRQIQLMTEQPEISTKPQCGQLTNPYYLQY